MIKQNMINIIIYGINNNKMIGKKIEKSKELVNDNLIGNKFKKMMNIYIKQIKKKKVILLVKQE